MKLLKQPLKAICSLYLLRLTYIVSATQFASHVSVNTPGGSFSHGVGDPVPVLERRAYHRLPQNPPIRRLRRPNPNHGGYPRQKPTIPFQVEDLPRGNSIGTPWRYNHFTAVPIQTLPPSPYQVDSPDPESLWPIGLFIPPVAPQRFGSHRRSDTQTSEGPDVAGLVLTRRRQQVRQNESGNEIYRAYLTLLRLKDTVKARQRYIADIRSDSEDPYLLEGSEAVAAVIKSTRHGQLYFHDVPHIESLLANQELRVQNNLKPHRIASIRQTWPFNRP